MFCIVSTQTGTYMVCYEYKLLIGVNNESTDTLGNEMITIKNKRCLHKKIKS